MSTQNRPNLKVTLLLIAVLFAFTLNVKAGGTITISSFSPSSGPVGTSVTITGTNFNTTASNNVVFFGATMATVTAATTTSLTVTVPAGATYAPVSVTNIMNGLTAYSVKSFDVTFAGGGSFAASVDSTAGSGPFSVAIGDLDGDGKADMAVTNMNDFTVSVFRNTGSSGTMSFDTKVDFATGILPTGIAIGDLDGDGKLDLVVVNLANGTVSVFRNTSSSGTISFDAKVDFATGNTGYYPSNVAIGDLDGDGKLDLVVTNYSDNTISVLRNTSTGGTISFDTKVDFTVAGQPTSVAIGDLDGDGKLDLAVTGADQVVWVLRNTGSSGTISFASEVDFAVGISPQCVAIGDLDGDGKLDMAVANANSYSVSVLHNTGSSGTISFASKVDFAVGISPVSVAIGDLDGDGKADLVISNSDPYPGNSLHNVSVLRNTGSSGTISFAIKNDYPVGYGVLESVAIGDLDGDGKVDLAVANWGMSSVSVLGNIAMPTTPPVISSVSPLSGSVGTSGITITGTNFNTLPSNSVVFFGATMATITNTSSTSLTVTVPAGATNQYISVTDITTGLTAYSPLPFDVKFANGGNFAAKVDFTTGHNPQSVAIGDLDGDGKADLVVTNYNDNTVSVFRNTGTSASPAFATKADFTTGTNPQSIAIGDLDGDGKLDLVVANFSDNTISVFHNTSSSGTISFAAKVDFTTGTAPISIAIGDLDGDGKADVSVANINSNTVSVLRNTGRNGTISFAAKVDFATGTNPQSVAIGDLDGDGMADMAVADANSSTVSVFRNTGSSGTISFDTKVDFTTGNGTQSVAIGDLDGDGMADMAVANYNSNTVSVLHNTGSSGTISFAAKVDYTTGTGPNSVAIGDLNGDGKADLAVTNYSSNTASVLRNTGSNGTISFAAKVDFATGSNPASIVIGDLDGDGKSDLAITNANSNTVSLLLNISPPVPTITSFTPVTGAVGGSVTITGTNFNATASDNVVFFGATMATVTAATATSLTVTVPAGATNQYISVTDMGSGLTAYSPLPFDVTFANGGGFAAKVDFTTGTGPQSIAIGDLDGDGKADLVVTNYTSGTISVFRNTGTATSPAFATKVDFGIGGNPRSIAIGDLDGDGKLDLAVVCRSTYMVEIFRNTSTIGTISFDPSYYAYTTGTAPFSVAIGDLDGDGKLDMAVANTSSSTVSVFRNTSSSGTISFAAKVDYTTGTNPFSVAIGDLDGDGKLDMAVANTSSSTVSVFRNTGSSGTISFAAKVDYTAGPNPVSIAIGDLDGDGKLDLAVANTISTVSVFRNTGSSGTISFATKVDYTTGASPYSVAIGDLDGDGKLDLAVANTNGNTVSALRNTGSSGMISFATKVDYTTGASPYSVAIGDLDGDGKADLAIANGNSGTVSVLRNIVQPPTITSFTPVAGAVGSSVTITGTNFNATASNNVVFFGATMATVTAATATSLTVTVPAGATNQYISVTDMGSNLTAYSPLPFDVTFANGGGFAAKVDYTTGTNPFRVAIGDLDGDGKTDLAVANFNSNTVSVFRNTGSSGTVSFAAKVDFTTGTYPQGIAIGDLDGDGKLDLAVANTTDNTVSVFRNTGSSGTISFATKVDYTTGTNPGIIVIGDLDGDGKVDLAVTNYNSNTVSVFRNTGSSGTISFAAKVDYTTGTKPSSIAMGDLDGDGKVDLAVTNYSSNTVSVFRNTGSSGTISFATKVDYTTGTGPNSVAIGDLDRDGKLDIAAVNVNSNSVSVFHNTGSSGTISFAAKVDYTTGAGPQNVTIGDLDGDGKLDMVVANTSDNTASVLRNTGSSGTISFATKVDYTTGTTPRSIAIGDLDGDGKSDLAITNYSSNTVSLLLNIIPAPSNLSYSTPNTYTKGTAITSLSPTVTGSVVSYSVSPGLPSGLSINTGTGVISGTPSAVTTATNYTVTATNGTGSTTAIVNITVNDIVPSSLSYTTPGVYTKGTSITSLSPTVSGGAVVSYSVSPGLPAGLSINTTTGVISGTPTAITAAANYTVTATNSGGSTTAIVNITVNDIAPSNLSYTAPDVYTKGTAITTLNPTVSGGAVVSYSVSPGLPAGLSMNTGTGVISGTPSAVTTATNYTVTATNSGGSTTAIVNITVNDMPAYTWTGGTSTDWNTASNWDANTVPANGINVIIAGGTTYSPSITTLQGVKDITINSGATVTINGGTLNISGAITNNGTIDATNGTIGMTGVSAQTIPSSAFAGNTIQNFTVNNTAGVTLGGALNVTGLITPTNGTLTTGGYLTLKSTANGTASIATGNGTYISGNVTVERYVPSHASKVYTMVSSPVNSPAIYEGWQESGAATAGYGTQITGAIAGNGFDAASAAGIASIYSYDDNNASGSKWVGLSNTNSNRLSIGTGYLLFVRGDRTVMPGGTGASGTTTLRATGTLTTGTVNFAPIGGTTGTKALTNGANMYSLIANPYPSPIDWTSGTIIKTNITSAFTVYDPNLGIFVTSDGTTVSPNVSQQQAKYIQSGQAFFVQNAGSGTPGLTITEDAKIPGTATGASSTVFGGGQTIPEAQLNVNVYKESNQAFTDGAVAVFNNSYSRGYDSKDADKFRNFGETVSFTTEQRDLSIAARPLPQQSDTLWLNMQNMSLNTAYKIRIDGTGWNTTQIGDVVLIDTKMQITTPIDLSIVNQYSFTPTEQNEKNRLMIVLNNKNQQQIRIDSSNNVKEGLSVKILGNPVTEKIELSFMSQKAGKVLIRIISTDGQVVEKVELGEQQQGTAIIPVKNDSKGVYIVEVTVGKERVIKRVMKN